MNQNTMNQNTTFIMKNSKSHAIIITPYHWLEPRSLTIPSAGGAWDHNDGLNKLEHSITIQSSAGFLPRIRSPS